jgi:hypothetical protein
MNYTTYDNYYDLDLFITRIKYLLRNFRKKNIDVDKDDDDDENGSNNNNVLLS